MFSLKLEMFGPTENSPNNMGVWSTDVTAEDGCSVLDVVKNIIVYEKNTSLRLIIDSVVKRKDLTAGVFLFNGRRIIDYEEFCGITVKQGNTISILPQLIAG